MKITTTRSGNENKCLTVFMKGELDHHATEPLKNAIDAAILAGECSELILDMTEVSFMDSSGLGIILGRYRIMEKNGGVMFIKGAGRGIDRILTMSGIYKLVKKI